MKRIDIAILLVLGILLILPAFVAENKYPFSEPVNDFQNDVNRAEQAKINGNINDISNHYFGRTIMAYTVGKTSLVTNISCETLQKWINYIVLFLACITIYFITSRIFNRVAGFVSSITAFFCVHSMLILFSSGDIWNIVEIGIILIPLLYFMTEWFVNKKKAHLVLMLAFAAIFSSIHPLALILPYILGFIFGCYGIYCLVKKNYIEVRNITLLYISIAIGNLVLSNFFIADALSLHYAIITRSIPESVANNTMLIYSTRVPINISTLLYEYITLPIIGMLVIIGVTWQKIGIKLDTKKQTWFLLLLMGFVIPFIIAAMTKINIDPIRHAMDASTLIAIVVGCVIGTLIVKYKSKILNAIVSSTIAIGIIPTLVIWFSTQGK